MRCVLEKIYQIDLLSVIRKNIVFLQEMVIQQSTYTRYLSNKFYI